MALKIDIHSHFFPEIEERTANRLCPDSAPWLRKLRGGRGMIMTGGRDFRPVGEACWNPAVRLEDMDRDGIDLQIMCATPVMFGYALPAGRVIDWARRINDQALEICAHRPERFRAMCQVPLQDLGLSCEEATRCRESGHVGVQIGNHVGERNLDDGDMVRFLNHCAGIGLPVFVHPWDMMAPERMRGYMLQWLVGMPAETHLGILALVLSGAFERLSKDLKLCFAHGGGNFAYQLGRVDNAWLHRDIVREHCPQPPSAYVDRFSVDSAVFSAESLALLVEVMGAERVMLGSDYPFPLGERRIGALVEGSELPDDRARRRIAGGNAAEFFDLAM